MKITIAQINQVININTYNLKVLRTTNKDFDSINLEIYYSDFIIGHGHLNNRTNFAHITLNNENQELEDYLVASIESRNINLI